MSRDPIPILTTPVELFKKPSNGSFAVLPDFTAEIGIHLVPGEAEDDPWQIRFLVREKDKSGTEKSKSYPIEYDQGHFKGELVDGQVYVFKLRELEEFTDLLGLDFTMNEAATLVEVQIEVRPRAGDEGWIKEAPFAVILFCWDLTAKTEDEICLPGGGTSCPDGGTNCPDGDPDDPDGGSICSEVDVMVRAHAGLSAIAPPDQGKGISNFAVRLDLKSIGVSTGWILLLPVEMPTIPDFDLPALSNFHMPALLKWLSALVPDFSLPDDIEIDPIDWDMDFPLRLDLPLDMDFDESSLHVRNLDRGWRITTKLKGLRTRIGPIEVNKPNFAVELSWEDEMYLLRVVFADLYYPEQNDQTEPYVFNLPFDLLSISAVCWRLRVGLFAKKTSDRPRFCFDTLLEIGDLTITYSTQKKQLYKANVRVHMRDLLVLTGKPQFSLKLFNGIDSSLTAFNRFREIEVPALSFVKPVGQLSHTPENEYEITFLGGSYKEGERLHLAWKHRGAQILRALSADLLGTEPVGVIPDDTAELWMALEIASFQGTGDEKDTQVRLDWSYETPVDVNGKVASSDQTITGEICVDPSKALFVPERSGTPPALKDITTGDNAFSLALPGVAVSLHRPSSHSLVFRREGDGRESFAWLGNYAPTTNLGFGDGKALASAALDFTMSPPEGGRRQVQPSNKTGTPFLEFRLGHVGQDVQRAVQIAAWRSGERLRFLQTYRNTAPPLTQILVGETSDLGLDDCPGSPPASAAAVPLPVNAFRGFGLHNPGEWELALGSSLVKSFLNLFGDDAEGKSVELKIIKLCVPAPEQVEEEEGAQEADDGTRSLIIRTKMIINMPSEGTLPGKIEGDINFRLNIDDLALSVEDGAELGLELGTTMGLPPWASDLASPGTVYWKSDPFKMLGLEMRGIFKALPDESIETIKLLSLTLEDGRFALGLPEGVELLVHYRELGDGLVFRAEEFVLGSGGLDMTASLLATKLKLPGLQKPFSLEKARLEIAGGRMKDLVISGSGQCPAILNDAPVEISVHLANRDGRIQLVDFECELGDGDAPIFSRGIRCRFQITKITIDMDDRGGTRPQAWFFRISGSLTFVPEGEEFKGKLLEAFNRIELTFANAPLGDEFFEHVELIASLTKPEKFPVLNLFEMEVRSIGFHPRFSPFGTPAIIIGGQVAFAEIGDVPAVQVDFHKLYLGFPKPGEILPQMEAKGLRVEIATSGFKIAGRVEHRDDDLVDGFLGEGSILIPGMPELSAAFGFAKLRSVAADTWKHGWFIAIEAGRISYPIGPLPLYLRQIGLGFGYRFTSVLITKFESEDRLGPLIQLMLAEINKHQSLARIESWAPDAERDGGRARWSIGLEGVFSLASGNSTPMKYEPEMEKKLRTLVAQMLVFVQSDFTFMAAAKIWYPISPHDFFINKSRMRNHPLALGFMAYSAPKNRLLIHAVKGKDPYLGPSNDPVPDVVKKILGDSHFEATLLSEPSLVHAELGWPNRLLFKVQIEVLKMECRGGVLFRLERDLLIQGISFSARAELTIGGDLSAGIVGTEIKTTANFLMGVRMLMSLALSRPLQSNIYAAIGVDMAVEFSVYTWFRLDTGFCKISADARFALDLQIVVALEVGWAGQANLGFRARATVMIGAFGRRLTVGVRASAFGDKVAQAQTAMKPYLRSFLEPGSIPPIPGGPDVSVRASHALSSIQGNLGDDEKAAIPVGETLQGAKSTREETDGFVFSVTRGRTDEQGRRLWFGWIMPNPAKDHVYPVNRELFNARDPEKRYATLVFPHQKGVSVYAPKLETNDTRKLTWKLVDNEECGDGDRCNKVVLTLNLDAFTKLEYIDNKDEITFRLGQMLAGCYVPYEKPQELPSEQLLDFPLKWPDGLRLKNPDQPQPAPEPVKDSRILDPDNPALSPRRQLDPDDQYDQALQEVMSDEEVQPSKDKVSSKASDDQAVGNQTFLFRCFMDDLEQLSKDVKCVDGRPEPISDLIQERPHLADLGMFVCVVAETCPDWLYTREVTDKASLTFHEVHEAVEDNENVDITYKGEILPVMDFKAADFSVNKPLIQKTATWFDDETLNFGWTIDWGSNGIPGSVFGEGNAEIEMFLSGYEITLELEGQEDPIDRARVLPADTITPETNRRIVPRFQYSKQLRDLPLDSRTALSTAERVTATIRPLGQDGTVGERFSITAEYRQSKTPLAADDATLILRQDKVSQDSWLIGNLEWRELLPTNDPDVAPTYRWELILRPLSHLPLGAWPSEATDTEDSGLASLGSTGLRDGDIILTIRNDEELLKTIDDKGLLDDTEEAETRPQALRRIRVELGKGRAESVKTFADGVYDFEGKRQGKDTISYRRADSFLKRKPATHKEGAGWYVFLRAASLELPKDKDPLPRDGYSSIVPVTLVLMDEDSSDDSQEGATRDTPIQSRTLEHLEWPETLQPWMQVPEVTASQGNLHVAGFAAWSEVPDQGKRDGADSVLDLDFLPLPGRDRGVTINWSAVWGGNASLMMERIAAYQLYEVNMDALVNFDVPQNTESESKEIRPDKSPKHRKDFKPNWLRLREIRPTDRVFAGRSVSTFVQPEIWDAVAPVHRVTLDWLSATGISQEEMPEKTPGWYSWADHELAWPDAQTDAQLGLEGLAKGFTNDLATYAEKLEQGDFVERTRALAALYELGRYAAKRNIHPWLAVVFGRLVIQGAIRFKEDSEPLERFTVEISPGKPAIPDETNPNPPDPVEWIENDVEELDPLGWGALWHFGLSATVSLRNPITGLYLMQEQVRLNLAAAITSVDQALEKLHKEDLFDNLASYRLEFRTVLAVEELPKEDRYSVVIVALVGTDLHIRIFSVNGEIVADDTQKELMPGVALKELKDLEQSGRLPNVSDLSPTEQRNIVANALSCSCLGFAVKLISPFGNLAFDLPLQTQRAIHTKPGKMAISDPATLSMVQVSLRPLAESFQQEQTIIDGYKLQGPGIVRYGVAHCVRFSVTKRKYASEVLPRDVITEEHNIKPPIDLALIFPDDEDRNTVIKAGSDTPATLFLPDPGHFLLLRWQQGPAKDKDHGDPVEWLINESARKGYPLDNQLCNPKGDVTTEEHNIKPPIDLALIFPDDEDRNTVIKAGSDTPAPLFLPDPGHFLLIRWQQKPPNPDAPIEKDPGDPVEWLIRQLKGFVGQGYSLGSRLLQIDEINEVPLPIKTKPKSGDGELIGETTSALQATVAKTKEVVTIHPSITPFERFVIPEKDWERYVFPYFYILDDKQKTDKTRLASRIDKFVDDYLVESFLQTVDLGPDASPEQIKEAEENAKVALRQKILEKEGFAEKYRIWGNRFFRATPIGERYDLYLMQVVSIDNLPIKGLSLVVVALINTALHIRIFDAIGEQVVDKAENKLVPGEALEALIELMQSDPFPGESDLSANDKQDIVVKAASCSGHALVEKGRVFMPNRLTAAMPKRIDPARMAADAQGRFTYTHIVTEDWASSRGYSVRVLPRYRELQKPGEVPPVPEFSVHAQRADVEIPRRRRIAPPKLLGVRLLEDIKDVSTETERRRLYYEVTISDHVEQALTRANKMLAHKLEFQFLQRRFELKFARPDWITVLKSRGIFNNGVEPDYGPGGPDNPDWKELRDSPSDGLGTEDFLAHAPMARFGAHKLVTPAEPGYYTQKIQVRAKAVQVESTVLQVEMPHQPGRAPIPWQEVDSAPPFEIQKNKSPDWLSYSQAVAPILKTGTKMIADRISGSHANQIRLYLEPSGYRVRARFPRLIELLEPWSLTAHWSAETAAWGFGRLPDPDGRVEIVLENNHTRETLAVIEPELDPLTPDSSSSGENSMRTFLVRAVTQEMAIKQIHNSRDLADWTKGLFTTVDLVMAPKPVVHSLDEPLTDVPLTNPNADQTDTPEELLKWMDGPLAQLAPILSRLHLGEKGSTKHSLVLHNPRSVPDWVCRPHRQPKQDEDDNQKVNEYLASERDLALGLRLYLDPVRRAAAFEVRGDLAVLRNVEEAEIVLPISAAGNDATKIEDLITAIKDGVADNNAHFLWRYHDGDWEHVDNASGVAEGDLVLALLGAKDEVVIEAYMAAVKDVQYDPARSELSTEIAMLMARRAWQPIDRRSPVAFAHHGNVEPSPWR
ncbi:MAG: hypothetical protein AB2766_12690 [Candidatus Thiodiazotropha endolucinida]